MPPRDTCTIRISRAGLDVIDKLASDTSSTRSETLRAILSEALATDTVMTATRKRLTRANL